LVKAVKRFAYDRKLAFDRSLGPFVCKIGFAAHAFDETLDIRARLVGIREQDAGVSAHR